MLVMRLQRVGKRNQPAFKIVVVEKRSPPRGGQIIDEIGFYNPLTKELILRKEKIQSWLSKGVKPSETVHNLLVRGEIIEGKLIPKHKKPKEKEEKNKTFFGKPKHPEKIERLENEIKQLEQENQKLSQDIKILSQDIEKEEKEKRELEVKLQTLEAELNSLLKEK